MARWSIRIWILVIALMFSLLAIRPSFGGEGVLITAMDQNSSFFAEGLRAGEIILEVNDVAVKGVESYLGAIGGSPGGVERRVDIRTDEESYIVLTDEDFSAIAISEPPRSRIQTGLDLRGGARALVKPDVEITDAELVDLVEIARNRFNVYGLSDVNIRGVTDFSGDKFLLVEIAGATPDDLEQLIGQQGRFEAKIANQTVFEGGVDKDIRDVCRNDATCAGVTSCFPAGDGQASGFGCSFQFVVYLSQEAAQRHADITATVPLDPTGQYLEESLFLYVDDNEVDSLRVGASLRGSVTTQISIQGSGSGDSQESALVNTRAEMKSLQTVLLTGSLPYKLDIVRLDTISPTLGAEFTRAILLAGASAMLLVSLLVFIRYRKLKASLALLFTAFSELVIILGVASFIGWNLDLPSIAGILATIGTGVDQQIVIIDESRKKNETISMRMKSALFVIMTAYLTSVVSLIPLWWAGAGLFKGFAITTIIGITSGVLITRPAFADMIRSMSSE